MRLSGRSSKNEPFSFFPTQRAAFIQFWATLISTSHSFSTKLVKSPCFKNLFTSRRRRPYSTAVVAEPRRIRLASSRHLAASSSLSCAYGLSDTCNSSSRDAWACTRKHVEPIHISRAFETGVGSVKHAYMADSPNEETSSEVSSPLSPSTVNAVHVVDRAA